MTCLTISIQYRHATDISWKQSLAMTVITYTILFYHATVNFRVSLKNLVLSLSQKSANITLPYWLTIARTSIALVPFGKLFTNKLALAAFSVFGGKSM